MDLEWPTLRRRYLDPLARVALCAYQDLAPHHYAAHAAAAEAILPAWRLAETPWTSGVINANNQLAYHVDGGNLPGSWSAQYTWRGDTSGGLLAFPQLSLAVDLAEGSLLLFDGGQLVHGVTPISQPPGGQRRYSVVLYTRAGCLHCLEPAAELVRARRIRTLLEYRRAQRHPQEAP